MSMDGLADICSCNICTSTIRGGRITQGARDGNANMFMDEQNIAKSQEGGANMFKDEPYLTWNHKWWCEDVF